GKHDPGDGRSYGWDCGWSGRSTATQARSFQRESNGPRHDTRNGCGSGDRGNGSLHHPSAKGDEGGSTGCPAERITTTSQRPKSMLREHRYLGMNGYTLPHTGTYPLL